MDSTQKNALIEKHTKIIETIDINEVVHGLFEKKVIPSYECVERITKCGVTRQDKATELLHVVTKSDNPNAFNIFLGVLQVPYSYLAKEIKDTVHQIRRTKRPLKKLRLPQQEVNEIDTTAINVKTVQNNHNRNSCAECRNPLTPTISVEAGVSCTCIDTKVQRPTSEQIVSSIDNFSLSETQIESSIGNFPQYETEVKQRMREPGTILSGTRVSFQQNSFTRGISEDQSSQSKSNFKKNNNAMGNPSVHPYTDDKIVQTLSLERDTFVKQPLASSEEDTCIKQPLTSSEEDTCIKQPATLKCLGTPPPPKTENLVPCFTSPQEDTNTVHKQTVRLEEKLTKAPPTYNINLKEENVALVNKVSNWEKKAPNGFTNKATQHLVYENPVWPTRAPNYKSNIAPTQVHGTTQKQILNENLENLTCVTLGRKSKTESFGFKFVPGSGVRKRFDGDNDYYITEIIPGTVASEFKELKINVTLKYVNDKPIKHMKYDDVVKLFQHSLTVKLKVEPYVASEQTFL